MVRIKRSVNSKKSRRKTMKQAKGYTGARSRTLRAAKEQVMHAGADSFTHRKDKKGWDELYHSEISMVHIPPSVAEVSEKHGSGCVLSSALASNLTLGIELEDACGQAKYYTEQFLKSHSSLLGIHTNLAIK